MGKPDLRTAAGHYDANYKNFQTDVYAQIRLEAFGADIGQNSWLTADESDKFIPWLDLDDREAPRRCLRSGRPSPANCRPNLLLRRWHRSP